MKAQTEKTNKKQLPIQRAEQQSSTGGTATIEDNRPRSVYQRKLQRMMNASNDDENNPIQRKPNNTGLPGNLKTGIENLSGYSMDDVKVHYNSSKPAQLQAHAYAQGTNIHLAPGQEKHLPHEAWHVVQQKQGRVRPTMQFKGKVNINDDIHLEAEADLMGARAMLGDKIHSEQKTGFIAPAPEANAVVQRRKIFQGAMNPNIDQNEEEIERIEVKQKTGRGWNFNLCKYFGCFNKPEIVETSSDVEEEPEEALQQYLLQYNGQEVINQQEQEHPFFTIQNTANDDFQVKIISNPAFEIPEDRTEPSEVEEPLAVNIPKKKRNFFKKLIGLGSKKNKNKYDIGDVESVDEAYVQEAEYLVRFVKYNSANAANLVVSDDLSIAHTNETNRPREFYATQSVYDNLPEDGMIEFQQEMNYQLTLKDGDALKSLYKVVPVAQRKEGSNGLESLPPICIEMASAVMGILDDSYAHDIILGQEEKRWMKSGTAMGDLNVLDEIKESAHTEEDEQRMTINNYAFPSIGQAYASFALDRSEGWGYHFGTVVASSEDQNDNLTMENYNRKVLNKKVAALFYDYLIKHVADFDFDDTRSYRQNYENLVQHLYGVNSLTANIMWNNVITSLEQGNAWYFEMYGRNNGTWHERQGMNLRPSSNADNTLTLVMAKPAETN